jgi:hypothetical protein
MKDFPPLMNPSIISVGNADFKGQSKWQTFDFETLDDDFYSSCENDIIEAYNKKRGVDISKISDLRPGISEHDKMVFLPDTVKDPQNLVVKAMASLAGKLGYTVRVIPYGERKNRDISTETWKYSAGISFVTIDLKNHLKIKRKDDPYEFGRTFARAQQVCGMFKDNDALTMDCLKKDHKFFGNNPNENETQGKFKVPTAYLGRTLDSVFIEEEWAKLLASLLLNLLKRSWTLLSEEVIKAAEREHCLSYSEAVSRYMEREVLVTPSRGRQPAIYKRKVPKLPRDNPLLTKDEMSTLSNILKPVFTSEYPSAQEQWVDHLKENTWRAVKSSLEGVSQYRAELLSKFASITTKRLGEAREAGLSRDKRKKDATRSDVGNLLLRRANPADAFAQEIAKLDPTFSKILKSYWRSGIGKSDSGEKFDYQASIKAIISGMNLRGIYSDIYELKELGASTFSEGTGIKLPKTPMMPKDGLSLIVHNTRKAKFANNKLADEVFYNNFVFGYITDEHEAKGLAEAISQKTLTKAYKNLKNDADRQALLQECSREWVETNKVSTSSSF